MIWSFAISSIIEKHHKRRDINSLRDNLSFPKLNIVGCLCIDTIVIPQDNI